MSNRLNYRVNILDSRTNKLTSPNLVAVKDLEKDMRCAGYVETSKNLTSTLNTSLEKVKQSSDKVYNQALKIVYFKDRQYKSIDIAAFLGINKKQLENFTYNHKDKMRQAEDSLVQAGGSIAITHAVLENLNKNNSTSSGIGNGIGNPHKSMSNNIPQELYNLSRREYEILKRKFILDYVDKNNKKLPGYQMVDTADALRYYRMFTNNKIFMTNDNLLKRYSYTISQADKYIMSWLISLNKYNEISNQLNHVYELYPEDTWSNINTSPDDVFADRTYDEAEKIIRHKVMQIAFLKGLGWDIKDIMKRVGVTTEFITDNLKRQKINVDWVKFILKDMGGYPGVYKIISGKSKLRKDQQGIIDYELMLNVARELQPEYIKSRQK